MAYNSKNTGAEIQALLDSVAGKQDAISDLDAIRSGAEKGATALQSIPSEYVTETELTNKGYATISALNDKVDKVSGKQLSTEDFTSALKTKLEGLSNYDDTELSEALSTLRGDFDKLVSGDTTTAIKTFNEVIAFLDGIQDTQDLSSIIASIEQQIAGKYTKPSGGIPASDLAPDVFLQGEKGEKGDKGDTGETGPKGDQGEQGVQGPKGEDGVGIASVVQTTTSSADGGSNVVTVTLSDGKTSTFTVKNGSKGSQGEKGDKGDTGAEGPQGVQGIQGIQGPKGDTGADGAQGPKGDKGDKGDTGAAGTNGTNGISVSSVKQTTTSSADGGTNVVTVTLSNGTTSTFNVKNGSKGSNGTNGTNGTNGKDGVNGATFTPSVDANGNLSWTNDKGLANPATVNIKGPKGDKGDAGSGGSGGGSGAYAEVNHGTSDTTFTLTSNTFHVWDEVADLTLTLGSETSGVANEYLFQFTSGSEPTTLTMSDDIKWTEELVIEANRIYQVSILKGLASVLSWEVEASIVFPITLEMGNNGENGVLLYNYFADTYGQATAGTAITEEIYNNGFGTSLPVYTIEYGEHSGYTGYWLNDYGAMKMSWVLQSDGYMMRVVPNYDEM